MNPIVDELKNDVTETVGTMKSATVLINGFSQAIQDAIQKALENGATEEELQPFTDLDQALKTERQALAEAVAANQPPGGG